MADSLVVGGGQVRIIGLTGGIGSGKSTVEAILARRGAVVIDADRVAREVVEPGKEAYRRIVEHFGTAVVGEGGELDRAAIARVVFADRDELRFLNSVTHPAVGEAILERLGELSRTRPDAVVFLSVPLLVETGGAERYGTEAVVVVDVPPELAVQRLVESRGMTREDAKARVAAQAPRADRLRAADHVIDNSGNLSALEREVDRVLAALGAL
ncbi:MAG: dephospho-CoA kinase [Actinomycetota bacterium]|nr:dephospho-CoA kinase [Actinomycetota bacterium]